MSAVLAEKEDSSADTNPQCYTPTSSLWKSLEAVFSPSEQQEIKQLLGESLVEQTLELHYEVKTLLEILQASQLRAPQIPTVSKLPEPPEARERLRKEIRYFVTLLNEGGAHGRAKDLLNSAVVQYAFKEDKKASMPTRPLDLGFSGESKTAVGSSSFTNSCVHNAAELSIADVDCRLTDADVTDTIHHLQATLLEEVSHLTRNIRYLQYCLEEEVEYQHQRSSQFDEPSLTDMRHLRNSLEKMLLSNCPVPQNKHKSCLLREPSSKRTEGQRSRHASPRLPIIPVRPPVSSGTKPKRAIQTGFRKITRTSPLTATGNPATDAVPFKSDGSEGSSRERHPATFTSGGTTLTLPSSRPCVVPLTDDPRPTECQSRTGSDAASRLSSIDVSTVQRVLVSRVLQLQNSVASHAVN
ncbi:PREDICTED: uncharacterized protein LOC106807847 isoform X2 [Priapulus caudatus]|uniref:Uncharacterized protein LOC106807847 isoform X2 n=1 Tax=Priapulus caudatus TaxID=37621 RepID=A0ABM1E0T3_PRICU|nr:PREDICTED: uncharacterized protein LOC106807847 isoform X2 [Priapulus caudatus]